ncbi:MAG: hypothetical protein U0228_22775 [Myxococcaceae bacterium]
MSRLGLLPVLVASWAMGADLTLRYERPETGGCPDERALRELIAARLGVDPFVEQSTSVVAVKVLAGAPWSATITLQTADNPPRRRALTAGTCVELLDSVAVAVALAVDPLVKKQEPPPPVESPPVAVPTPTPAPAPAPVAPPSAEPPRTPLAWSVAAGASANVGLAVNVQPTLRVEGRARVGVFSLGLEARFGWPIPGALSQGALATTPLLAGLVPCVHWWWLAGCVELSAGALRLEGSALSSARTATVFHANAGARVVFQVPLGAHFALAALVEVQVPFTRAAALVGAEKVWAVWPVGGGAGLLAVARF